MSGINFPVSIDWFSGILSGILVSVSAGMINSRIKNEITTEKLIGNFFVLFLSATLLFSAWYNGVGYVLYLVANNEKAEFGCGNAIFSYENAISWNPRIINARWGLVNCSIELGRLGDSIFELMKDETKLRDEPEYWQQLSLLYLKNNDLENLLIALSFYADMRPDNYSEWINDIGYRLMNESRYSDAEATMRLFLNRTEDNGIAVFWLAWSLFEQGKIQDSIYYFNVCVATLEQLGNSYKLGRCYAGLGFANLEVGNNEFAKSYFVDAISIYADQPDVKDALLKKP